jgi:LacI family transcriptional regulator
MKDKPKSVTIRWLAEQAGVSVATISRTLRNPDSVAPETRERILKLVNRHHFVPDGRAATFSSQRTGVVGLIVPTISNSIYAEFTEAIQNRLQAADLSLLIANANYSADIERQIIRKLIESRVEGVILTGYKREPALYELLRHYRIPFVVTWSLSPKAAIPAISFDNRAAAAEATEMLIKLGHNRIGLICGMTSINDRAAQRLRLIARFSRGIKFRTIRSSCRNSPSKSRWPRRPPRGFSRWRIHRPRCFVRTTFKHSALCLPVND